MKTFSYLTSIAFAGVLLCCSCDKKNNRFMDDPVYKGGDREESVRADSPGIAATHPVPVQGSGTIVIPLAARETRNSSLTPGEPLYYYSQSPVWNLLFYDIKTKVSHLVDENGFFEVRKVVMPCDSALAGLTGDAYDTPFYADSPFPFILFEAIPERYAHDTIRKEDRPFIRSLYTCDLSGNHLRRLSPPAFQLESWRVIDSVNYVIEMMGNWDSDGDKLFENAEHNQVMFAHLRDENPLNIPVPADLSKEYYKKYKPFIQLSGTRSYEK